MCFRVNFTKNFTEAVADLLKRNPEYCFSANNIETCGHGVYKLVDGFEIFQLCVLKMFFFPSLLCTAPPRNIEASMEMKDFDRVCVYVDNKFQAEDSFTVRKEQTKSLGGILLSLHKMVSSST